MYVRVSVCVRTRVRSYKTQTNDYNHTENSTKHPLVVWEVNDGV